MSEPPAPPPAPDLAAITARAAAATPEPWEMTWDARIADDVRVCQMGADPDGIARQPVCIGCLSLMGAFNYERDQWEPTTIDQWKADAAFIAAARQDVPALVAYARALDAANARLRAGLEGLRLEHVTASDYYEECPKAYSTDRRTWIRAHHTDWEEWLAAPCSCGADAHNARIDALLTAP